MPLLCRKSQLALAERFIGVNRVSTLLPNNALLLQTSAEVTL